MEQLWNDLRYGIRQLRRNPGFTAVAGISLMLGIAANITIFSILNGLLLRPLPGKNPSELVTVYTSDYSGPLYGASSYPDFLDFQRDNKVFTGLAAYSMQPMLLTPPGGTESVRVVAQLVSANYFDVLGVPAATGRTFLPDDNSGGGRVVVLGYATWERLFAKDAGLIGRNVRLNGQDFTVIGIASEGFQGMMRGLRVDAWVAISAMPELTGRADALNQRGSHGLMIFGRRPQNVSVGQAQANMGAIAGRLYSTYPQNWRNRHGAPRTITVLGEGDSRIAPQLAEPVKLFLRLLMVVVGLVLLIACTNVANLLLARGMSRRKEIAIRLSLGSGRGRLVQQLLTESVLLAGVAGVAGVLLASWATRLLMAFQPPLPVSLAVDLSMDGRVVVFAIALTVGTGVLFGLVPALRATRPDLVPALKDGGTRASVGLHRLFLRSGLVIAQVAMSLLLLIGAGLLLRSMANAHAIDPGFDPRNVLLLSMDLKTQGYTDARGKDFYRELQESVERMSGVEAASFSDRLPLGLDWQRRSITAEGYQPLPGEDMEHHCAGVSPGFFRVMRIPIVRGRAFTSDDAEGAPLAVVVSEAFAHRFWPGQNPLGKWVVLGGYRQAVPADVPRWTVVGVARDAKFNSLGEDPTPFIFFPHRQEYRAAMTLMVRTSGAPGAVLAAIKEKVKAQDAALPLYAVTTLEQLIGTSLVPVRMAATLLGIMGALALVLAGVGIYGVVAYSVSRRTQEIGLRMALGAQKGSILRMVLARGMVMTAIGLALGLITAAGVTRFATFLLYGISPLDPLTFIGVPFTLAAVATLASLLPALRAIRVSPVAALRNE